MIPFTGLVKGCGRVFSPPTAIIPLPDVDQKKNSTNLRCIKKLIDLGIPSQIIIRTLV
jgi:hypothetical protein